MYMDGDDFSLSSFFADVGQQCTFKKLRIDSRGYHKNHFILYFDFIDEINTTNKGREKLNLIRLVVDFSTLISSKCNISPINPK